MSKNLVTLLFVALFALATANPAMAARHYKQDYSISIPIGWVEMPKEVVDELGSNMAEKASSVKQQRFDAGFQSADTKTWLKYPHVIIVVNDAGRLPESELLKADSLDTQAIYDKQKNTMPEFMADAKAGKMIYDQKANIIWIKLEIKDAASNAAIGLTGLIPTEKGYIQVVAYCLQEDYPVYADMFQSIIRSVRPSKVLAYKARR